MRVRMHWAALAAAVLLAGCGGGGTEESSSVSRPLAVKDASVTATTTAATTSGGSLIRLPVLDDGTTEKDGAFKLEVVSSQARYVSGGDARIAAYVPEGTADKIDLWLNGRKLGLLSEKLGSSLEAVVDGLVLGQNTLELRHIGGRLLRSMSLTNYPINGPIFSGPQQYPFVCMTTQSAVGKQPLVETSSPPGHPVFDANGAKIGYTLSCAIETFVTYWYRSTAAQWKLLPTDGSAPSDMARTTLPDGRTVDFVVRQERGSINRFLYSFAMLAPRSEVLAPATPDLSLWNRRLQYWFQGGVAIGHSQGTLHGGAMNADMLATGTAVVHSSGNNTGTHYNLQLAAETAMMTKERFVERYGRPLYTYGLGGSGGAIQQYILAQNLPGILDAALPVQSYPDMVTQTIHVGDCELLENYMDVTDRNNPKWRTTKNRTWLVGMNAEDSVADPLAAAKTALGYSTAPGSTECVKAWRGLSPLAMNPWYGQATNQALFEPQSDIASIRWTHYDDLRNIYGVDATGAARPTWDNIGVQYGLKSMKSGLITPAEFLDLNWKVGGWKHPSEMVQEGYPFLGSLTPATFDPWSRRNMNLGTDASLPAPRTRADSIATRAAYTSGMVFGGQIPLPTIDHRQYMERELDMHNVHQSFAVRKRVIAKMGNADHVVIWFTDTMPGQPKASQSMEAIAVMDEWMANIRANPTKTVAQNRPARAVDSCFDVNGQLIYAGNDAWNGVIDDKPAGACTQAFPMYGTSRTVAGAPLEGGIYQCALRSVDAAIAAGVYLPWQPSAAEVDKLRQIFPDGVCDYTRPDQAKPS